MEGKTPPQTLRKRWIERDRWREVDGGKWMERGRRMERWIGRVGWREMGGEKWMERGGWREIG
jgi:hypothetical protein